MGIEIEIITQQAPVLRMLDNTGRIIDSVNPPADVEYKGFKTKLPYTGDYQIQLNYDTRYGTEAAENKDFAITIAVED